MMSPLREIVGCGMDRRAHAHIGRAAADIAVHRGIDVRVARLLVLAEQADRRHDLTGLAVAALDDIELLPCSLHGTRDASLKPLDGGALLAGRISARRHTG